MKKLFLVGSVAVVLFACSKQAEEDQLLWHYYRTFSYPPERMDSLLQKAKELSEDVYAFVNGLRYLEQCDFDPNHNPKYLDSARACFQHLVEMQPDDYKGYLGLGLTFTEYPDRDKRFKDTTFAKQPIRDSVFQIAFSYYNQAQRLRPDLEAVRYYWARALFYQKDSVFSLAAIQKLDSVIQQRPTFFKSHERAAQFLSHYHTTSFSKNEVGRKMFDSLKQHVPDFRERIRYHFDQSLRGDSSWYETYEGIANAKGIYPVYERVRFLEKAIQIARSKKSLDTSKLITMRWAIFADELSNYDAILDESATTKNKSEDDIHPKAQAYYYLKNYEGKQRFESLIQEAHSRLIGKKTDIANFWIAMAASNEPDTVVRSYAKKIPASSPNLQAIFAIELAKWHWLAGRTNDGIAVLNSVGDHKRFDKEVDVRLHAWLQFLKNWQTNNSRARLEPH